MIVLPGNLFLLMEENHAISFFIIYATKVSLGSCARQLYSCIASEYKFPVNTVNNKLFIYVGSSCKSNF